MSSNEMVNEMVRIKSDGRDRESFVRTSDDMVVMFRSPGTSTSDKHLSACANLFRSMTERYNHASRAILSHHDLPRYQRQNNHKSSPRYQSTTLLEAR